MYEKLSTKITESRLLYLGLTTLFIVIPLSIALFTNTEKSQQNVFASTVLDFALDPEATFDPNESISPDEIQIRNFQLINLGSDGFPYLVKSDNFSGDIELCEALEARLILNDTSEDTGFVPLMNLELMIDEVEANESLVLEVKLPEDQDDEDLQTLDCFFDIYAEMWTPNLSPGQGYFDTESFPNQISTGFFGDQDSIEIISNKPLIQENFLPGDVSDWGIVRVFNTLGESGNFYMYVTETDGNICPELDIELEVSDDGETNWIQVYDGELEEIRGNNDRVALTPNEDFSKDSLYVRQRITFSEEAEDDDAGRDCLWDEIFRTEGAEKETNNESTVTRNSMTAGFWLPPEVEVKDPNGGEDYEVGEEIDIKWKAKSHTHDQDDLIEIDIDLYDQSGDNFVMNIVTDTVNDSSYKWNIPENLSGTEFRIRIHADDGNDLENEDFSDEDFSIVP